MALARHSVTLDRTELAAALRALVGCAADPLREFIEAFCSRAGLAQGVAFGSATGGLFHAIQAAELEPGEVIVPEYEFHSVVQAIELSGQRCVFAPVDPATYLLDATRIEPLINKRTRALLYLHTFGLTADISSLAALCRERGLLLIEDCAHAAGGRHADKWGDIAIFSFGDGKSLLCLGGGLVCARDPGMLSRLQQRGQGLLPEPAQARVKRLGAALAKWGLTTRAGFSALAYPALRLGLARLATQLTTHELRELTEPPAQWSQGFPSGGAALGLLQLGRLELLNAARAANARALSAVLERQPGIETPVTPVGSDHTYLCYAIKVADAPGLARRLLNRGVDVRPDYMTCFNPDSPLADNRQRILYLPNHPNLTPEDATFAARAAAELL